MTALPRPGRLLTVAEYTALPEDTQYRWELLSGELVMTPSPMLAHNCALGELMWQLRTQLPTHLTMAFDLDVDLQLASPDAPGTVRRPDIVVVTAEEAARALSDSVILPAEGTLLAVEIVSPGTRRTDQLAKRADYADAGIPHYWIIDLEPDPTLLACHLAGPFGYQDGGVIRGRYETAEPFPVTIDLDALLR